MAAPTIPQAVQACHELLLSLILQLDKCPRACRFMLRGTPRIHPIRCTHRRLREILPFDRPVLRVSKDSG